MRDEIIELARRLTVHPAQVETLLEEAGTAPLRQGTKLFDLVQRPQLNLTLLAGAVPPLRKLLETLPDDRREEITEAAEILIKYEGYIAREQAIADKLHRLEEIRLRPDMDYNSLQSLSTEARQKLTAQRPASIGAASRIPGVSPNDINILLLTLNR